MVVNKKNKNMVGLTDVTKGGDPMSTSRLFRDEGKRANTTSICAGASAALEALQQVDKEGVGPEGLALYLDAEAGVAALCKRFDIFHAHQSATAKHLSATEVQPTSAGAAISSNKLGLMSVRQGVSPDLPQDQHSIAGDEAKPADVAPAA
jgi:hypothetical protein